MSLQVLDDKKLHDIDDKLVNTHPYIFDNTTDLSIRLKELSKRYNELILDYRKFKESYYYTTQEIAELKKQIDASKKSSNLFVDFTYLGLCCLIATFGIIVLAFYFS